jgi:nocardicin N-oxygenase
MISHGEPADLVQHLALPLPLTVICEVLGIPFEDRNLFHPWSDALLSLTAHTQKEIDDACAALDTYLADLIARRRAEPADDLLSTLVCNQDREGGLTEKELIHLGVSLLISGYPATASQITNFTYVLLTHPELWQQLLENPGLLPTAIEELLRYVPLGSNAGLPRVATRDVELSGVPIQAGDVVMIARPAASRDHGIFSNPDEIVLDREENPHLAFGYGIHRCLGAHLARMELQVALGHLLERLPGLRLAIPEGELSWKTGMVVRGLRELPVAWTPQ